MSKSVHFKLLYIFFVLILFASCTKQLNEATLTLDQSGTINVTTDTPVHIGYKVTGDNIDSISLWVNNNYTDSHQTPQNEFIYIPLENDMYRVKVRLYYQGGLLIEETFEIFAKYYYPPYIHYTITNTDGDEEYFMGEELKIVPELQSDDYDIRDCQDFEVIINNQSLGVKTEPPYAFFSDALFEEENTLVFKFTEASGAVRSKETYFNLDENRLPSIKIELEHEFSSVTEALVYDDYIKLDISAGDNLGLEKIEIYVNNEIVNTYSPNQFNFSAEYTIENIEKGYYEIYAKCYAQREQFSYSDTLKIHAQDYIDRYNVFNAIGGINPDNDSLIYYVDEHTFYAVNYQSKKVSKSIHMTYDVEDIEYSSSNNKIFIAHFENYLTVINEISLQVESVINLDFINFIDQIECDNSGRLLIHSGTRIFSYNPANNTHFQIDLSFGFNPSINYDQTKDEFIIGNDYTFENKVYKIKLNSNDFEVLDEKYINVSTSTIYINPQNNQMLVRDTHKEWNEYNLDPLCNFVQTVEMQSYDMFYNNDFSEIMITDSNELFLFDGTDFQINDYFKITQINGMGSALPIPTNDPNKWVIIVNNFQFNIDKILFFEKY